MSLVRTLSGVREELGLSDVVVWQRAREGDAGCFAAVFDLHRGRVYSHAMRLLGPIRADAEDATAIVFLELWRRRADVRVVNDSVLPWLLVTTTNVCLNLSRASRRYRAVLQRLPHPQPEETDGGEFERFRLDGELRKALLQLSNTDLHLFVLVVLEDYLLADAAAVVGVTVSSAKSRLHRSRSRLRQLLAHGSELDTRAGQGGR